VRARVLRHLPRRSWVHWSCHGGQSETDPARSAFQVWDGSVTVEDLGGVSLADPEFAYLSACETATGSTLLVDEALHLAAATQLLGYPHVVATLWSIRDLTAARVTEAVYRRLTRTGGPVSTDAALAVHEAIREERAKAPGDPVGWAPFVHLGP